MGASRPAAAFAADLASLLSVPANAGDALDRIALAVFLTTFVTLALQYREFCTPLDGVFIAVARALGSTCETWQDFLDAHGPDFGVVRNSAALLVAFAVSSIELNFRDDNWNNDEWIRAQPASKSAELLFRLEHFLVFE